ncbi:uncharacterized protein PITG_05236 [Phytophthora infestans T30-4]|uniref:Uncharacterized protein n=1 Tax=Phytophthora infestans (strain T30-4) TaxID=403677 RepID=D0N3V6_PHYIT|nr:uncharacterized protein PITG_05236 [Phytophthora infestans T30-4]EEY69060.1 conserved hypothetical protein [Phytophthora infestans T30-4]|eukprot:XP_002998914.1 conserved hypothetical protein [Phytophthora infestans T30-4]
MGRRKRKWTRVEIEEAIEENNRVNGVLNGLKEPQAKKRRMARYYGRRSALNKALKELEALEHEQGPGDSAGQISEQRRQVLRSDLTAEEQEINRERNRTSA